MNGGSGPAPRQGQAPIAPVHIYHPTEQHHHHPLPSPSNSGPTYHHSQGPPPPYNAHPLSSSPSKSRGNGPNLPSSVVGSGAYNYHGGHPGAPHHPPQAHYNSSTYYYRPTAPRDPPAHKSHVDGAGGGEESVTHRSPYHHPYGSSRRDSARYHYEATNGHGPGSEAYPGYRGNTENRHIHWQSSAPRHSPVTLKPNPPIVASQDPIQDGVVVSVSSACSILSSPATQSSSDHLSPASPSSTDDSTNHSALSTTKAASTTMGTKENEKNDEKSAKLSEKEREPSPVVEKALGSPPLSASAVDLKLTKTSLHGDDDLARRTLLFSPSPPSNIKRPMVSSTDKSNQEQSPNVTWPLLNKNNDNTRADQKSTSYSPEKNPGPPVVDHRRMEPSPPSSHHKTTGSPPSVYFDSHNILRTSPPQPKGMGPHNMGTTPVVGARQPQDPPPTPFSTNVPSSFTPLSYRYPQPSPNSGLRSDRLQQTMSGLSDMPSPPVWTGPHVNLERKYSPEQDIHFRNRGTPSSMQSSESMRYNSQHREEAHHVNREAYYYAGHNTPSSYYHPDPDKENRQASNGVHQQPSSAYHQVRPSPIVDERYSHSYQYMERSPHKNTAFPREEGLHSTPKRSEYRRNIFATPSEHDNRRPVGEPSPGGKAAAQVLIGTLGQDKEYRYDDNGIVISSEVKVKRKRRNSTEKKPKKAKRKKMYSDFIGVTYNKTHAKFQACITHYRKQHYLGRYKLAVDAARAYDESARLLKGKGWKVNFIGPEDYEKAKVIEIERVKITDQSKPPHNPSYDGTPKSKEEKISSVEQKSTNPELTSDVKPELMSISKPGSSNLISSSWAVTPSPCQFPVKLSKTLRENTPPMKENVCAHQSSPTTADLATPVPKTSRQIFVKTDVSPTRSQSAPADDTTGPVAVVENEDSTTNEQTTKESHQVTTPANSSWSKAPMEPPKPKGMMQNGTLAAASALMTLIGRN